MKPDIVAPGVSVRSAISRAMPRTRRFSGTSMAGPHVVGVVALLWSARPDLARDIAATKQIADVDRQPGGREQRHALRRRGHVPNNHFGWGLVDALAAYRADQILSVINSGDGTVTSTPAGIKCPATCSATFAAGTPVTLTAAAA